MLLLEGRNVYANTLRTHHNVTLYIHCTSCVLPNRTVAGRYTIKATDPIVQTMNKSTYKQII